VFAVAAWFAGGATISQPYTGSFPAPRRTGHGALYHPAPSLGHPQRCGVKVVDDMDSPHSPPSVSHPLRAPCFLAGARSSRANPYELTRPLCEMSKSRCHGHNPLCVGPYRPYSLSQTGAPLLGPHYQTSSLLWAPPTSDSHRPLPPLLHLSKGARFLPRRLSDLPGYRLISM